MVDPSGKNWQTIAINQAVLWKLKDFVMTFCLIARHYDIFDPLNRLVCVI